MHRIARLPLEALQPYLFAPPEAPVPLELPSIFGNDHPVEVEVGFGKGLFLLSAARACPDVNFLGVETARKYQLFTATRLAKRNLHNVRLVKADARLFFRDYLPAESVQAIHVYFPDPWWKQRHRKRRVFTPEFAVQCERVLRPECHLHVATDVEEYFAVITALLAQHTHLHSVPPPTPSEGKDDLDYLTNFERKFRRAGKTIWRATYERALTTSL